MMYKLLRSSMSASKVVAITLLLTPLCLIAAESPSTSGTALDNAYAAKLWIYMLDHQLIGPGRMRSYPFVGSRPHGSIQELISTKAKVDEHEGRLIVKHNYGAKEGLSTHQVYAANQANDYVALTIMFRREAGYDPGNDDWFWAEYTADGTVINHQGVDLSGRSAMCLSCHTPLGGKDREILNGRSR